MRRIAVLGAGPAGVGAAWKLATEGKARATVFERRSEVGGNAGSFEWRGHVLDFGSHRLHPTTDETILQDIRALLGSDLLDRPRHGRIRLRGRWLHFPLKPLDLLLHADKAFLAGVLADALSKPLRRGTGGDDGVASFGSVLRANLGRTICDHFYFPYARKIWGRDPADLAAVQARRRVAAGSFLKLLRKILSGLPGLKKKGTGRFFYPRGGFGSISVAYADAARRAGAEIRLGAAVSGLERRDGAWLLRSDGPGGPREETFDQIWSTIPLPALVRALGDAVPPEVRAAAQSLRHRAMVLVYLELEQERLTEFDAHYFPGEDLLLTRLSEPENYAVRTRPGGRTVLCAEVPCDQDDAVWKALDAELAERVRADLERAGLGAGLVVSAFHTARLPQAYPVYEQGYEAPFRTLDEFVGALPDFVSFGRQGLFAHDNTHHTLAMAYAASDCLGPQGFDRVRWATCRRAFESHVVED